MTFGLIENAGAGILKIDKLAIRENGLVYITISPALVSKPTCLMHTSWLYVFKVDADEEKGMLSLVLVTHITKLKCLVISTRFVLFAKIWIA